jgi:hypothetical protein
MLDCETTKGKEAIIKELNVKDILAKKLNIKITQPENKTSHDDGFIYRNGKLHGVCEIKTRTYWSRDAKTPFTLEKFTSDPEGYLITGWKLKWLKERSIKNKIYSYIFLNIPHDKCIVKFRVTDTTGKFYIDYNVQNSKTYYSVNDYKGKTRRENAFIPHKGNEEHIEVIKYG